VHGHIRLQTDVTLLGFGFHHHALALPAHGLDRMAEVNLYTERAGALDQHVHQVRIEPRQQTRIAIDHGDLCTSAPGNVGKFKSDVTATDQQQPLGQGF